MEMPRLMAEPAVLPTRVPMSAAPPWAPGITMKLGGARLQFSSEAIETVQGISICRERQKS
jgi:hypothetical protein